MNNIKYHDTTNDNLVRKLIINTISDIETIPAAYSPGTRCFVVDSGDIYVLSVDYKWVRLPTTSSGVYNGQTPLYWSGNA